MQSLRLIFVAVALALPAICAGNAQNLTDASDLDDADDNPHHKHKHHKHHHKHHQDPSNVQKPTEAAKPVTAAQPPVVKAAVQASVKHVGGNIVEKMKKLEEKLAQKAKAQSTATKIAGHLLVNGPLPADFNERFAQGVAQATGADSQSVQVTDMSPLEENQNVVEVAFTSSPSVVKMVENDAADPESKLATGNLRQFLVAKEAPATASTNFVAEKKEEKPKEAEEKPEKPEKTEREEITPVQEKGIDIDTQMPYGDLEPFGREDTAQELTESSVKESDEMVDQLERAEVAEEKRAVFRALTRLRGAAITSFDGVARSQTGNIDEYNKVHKWRNTHPLHHLADEESDVSKWAFPDNADF